MTKKMMLRLFAGFLISFSYCSGDVFAQNSASLKTVFESYYQDRLKLFPLEATSAGDNRYNDLLPNTISESFLKKQYQFYRHYKQELGRFDQNSLNEQDKISYSILMWTINTELEQESLHLEYIPFNQFYSLPLTMGQLGSGASTQPFVTEQDYDNWLKRIAAFTEYIDTSIMRFRQGVKSGVVLPRILVERMIPQFHSLADTDLSKSVFYKPVLNISKNINAADTAKIAAAYRQAISTQLAPAYTRLEHFLSKEYINSARSTSGWSDIANGKKLYEYTIYFYTSIRKSPDSFYKTGLREVDRITKQMEKVKDSIGFKGTLKDLFQFMKTNKEFMPFHTDEEVLAANRAVLFKIQPHLPELFSVQPKTPFEIRAIEKFRAAAAAPQYNRGSPDGTRPGIYYIPIIDPTKINITGWAIESTFLHEAIPGHHYQLSLQQEDTTLPSFRRFRVDRAFVEGWALYTESLGPLLGCYTDPYQRLGAFGGEIHRAIRLVVDVALHTGKMNREEAIKYMLDHESLPEQVATAEIERYMATPAQALSYKTGELKIKELRDKYKSKLRNKFSLRAFHDAILKGGSMPLDVFEKYMDSWAAKQF